MKACEELQQQLVQLKQRKTVLDEQVLAGFSISELLLGAENLRRDVEAFALQVDPERIRLLETLRKGFESQVEFWKKEGVLTENSLRKIPQWSDYEPLFTSEILERIKEGYNVPVLTPYYLPFYDENPEEQTFIKILATALKEEIVRDDASKMRKGIFFKPQDEKYFAHESYFSQNKLIFICDELKAHSESYQFQDDLPLQAENLTQDDVILRGKTLEMETGFIFKLFQDHAVLPSHIGQNAMSVHQWIEKIKDFRVLPMTLIEYVAYVLHILQTRHYLEDMTPSDPSFYGRFDQVTLALGTALPQFKTPSEGVVAITYYFPEKQFNFEKYYLHDPFSSNAFRGGIRLA
jgi:hypothetical protein